MLLAAFISSCENPVTENPAADIETVLSGIITASNTNQPIADVTVKVGTKSVQTGADGSYSLTCTHKGEYNLLVSHPSYLDHSEKITNSATQLVKNVSLDMLPMTTTLSGTVRHSVSNIALEGVIVRIGDSAVLSGSDGSYSIDVSHTGSIDVHARRFGYSKYTHSLSGITTATSNFDIILDGTNEHFTNITGTVTDEAGAPVNFAFVGAGYNYTTTAADGTYSLRVAHDGEFLLAVNGSGSLFYTELITVGNTDIVRDVQLTYETTVDTVISGTVVDSVTGLPIENASVTTKSDSRQTNANGEYSVPCSRHTGSFSFGISADGYVSKMIEVETTSANHTVDVSLVPQGTPITTTVSGVVTSSETGLPLANIDVYTNMNGDIWTQTNAQGEYSGTTTHYGEIEMAASGASYASSGQTVNTSDANVTINFALDSEVFITTRVFGVVVDSETNEPIQGAEVMTYNTDDNSSDLVYTDVDGEFIIDVVHGGSFIDITVGYGGYESYLPKWGTSDKVIYKQVAMVKNLAQ